MSQTKIISADSEARAGTNPIGIEEMSYACAYHLDGDMEENFFDGLFYYNDYCDSCKHWLGYDCGSPTGPCHYVPK